MPRISRRDMPGNFHHVMCQGVNKEFIFNEDNLKKYYKNLLKRKSQDNSINIISYCIMDNHVHLLLHTNQNKDMSKFMQQINTSFAEAFNKLNNRVGHVFRNRYLSKPILNEMQLQRCLVYIHKNPVVAKMVEKERDYNFSSYKEYLFIKNHENIICESARDIVFGTNDINYFIKQYHSIHRIENTELSEFDSFENTIDNNIEDLLNRYKNLTDKEKIVQLNSKDKISERNLAELFNTTRHQIRNILRK